MNYEIDAKNRGIGYVLCGLLSLVILCGINYMAYFSTQANHPPVIVMIVFSLIWILFSSAMISTGRKQVKKGGSWSVNVDELGFMWSSPHYSRGSSIDQSFSYSLEEIDYTETFRPTYKNGKTSNHPEYYLHLCDGRVQRINTNSGISINRIFKHLESLNIRHIKTISEPSKPDIEDACIV